MPDATVNQPAPALDATPAQPPHPVLRAYYQKPEERQRVVNDMFDETAIHYDRVTGLMSFGTGAAYRKYVLKRAGVTDGSHVLDIACGTGQVSEAAKQLVGANGRVLGVDPSAGMRAVAASVRGIETVHGTADQLPVEDASFDFVLMGYALRHVADLHTSFLEMRRVLRPGGKIVILEITAPSGRCSRAMVRLYMQHLVPTASMVITGSSKVRTLMKYYWDSIDQCASPSTILNAMCEAGFLETRHDVRMSFLTEYVGVAP